MAAYELQDVFHGVRWEDAKIIPVGNEENKTLQREIERQETEMAMEQTRLQNTVDQLRAMMEHQHAVQHERGVTEAVLRARVNEVDSERHILHLVSTEKGRLGQELKRLKKLCDELRLRKAQLEDKVITMTGKVEEERSEMDMTDECFAAWLQDVAEAHDNSAFLQDIHRKDEDKIKRLHSEINRLQEMAVERRRQQEDEVMDTNCAQVELSTSAEEFRRLHIKRQEVLRHWEFMLQQLQNREKEMAEITETIHENGEVMAQCRAKWEELKQFLRALKEENQELERKLEKKTELCANKKNQLQENHARNANLHNEVKMLKKATKRNAQETEDTRGQIRQLNWNLRKNHRMMDDLNQTMERLQHRKDQLETSSLGAEGEVLIMDELLAAEVRKQEILAREFKQLQDILYRLTGKKFDVQETLKTQQANYKALLCAKKDMKRRIVLTEDEMWRQSGLMYKQDMVLFRVCGRVRRMEGDTSSDKLKEMEESARKLRVKMDEREKEEKVLRTVIDHQQNELYVMNKAFWRDRNEQDEIMSEVRTGDAILVSIERELKRLATAKQVVVVEEAQVRLHRKELQDKLNRVLEEQIRITEERTNMESTMKLRRIEINKWREFMLAELKIVSDSRDQLIRDLNDSRVKIEVTKRKFGVLNSVNGADHPDEEKHPMNKLISALMEKEELKTTGDMLDSKIRKAQQEIKALSNTIRLIDAHNHRLQQSYAAIDEDTDGKEMREREQLERQMRELKSLIRHKMQVIKDLREELQFMDSAYNTLDRDIVAYTDLIENKEETIKRLKGEVETQCKQHERATKGLPKHLRGYAITPSTYGLDEDERDFAAREFRNFINETLKALTEVVTNHPEMIQLTSSKFEAAGIKMPLPKKAGKLASRTAPKSSASEESARVFLPPIGKPSSETLSCSTCSSFTTLTPSSRSSGVCSCPRESTVCSCTSSSSSSSSTCSCPTDEEAGRSSGRRKSPGHDSP